MAGVHHDVRPAEVDMFDSEYDCQEKEQDVLQLA